MIEEAVYQLLSGASALNAAVGGRIFAHFTTDAASPYLVFRQVTGNPSVTISAGDGQEASTLQIDVYAKDPTESREIAERVRDALHKYSGTLAGVTIQYILLQAQRPDHDQEANLHRVTLEFIAKHN